MINNYPIYVTRSSMPDFEEYVYEIKDLWDSHCLTNMGAKHKEFESELRSYLGMQGITLFANGHLALECAIGAFGLSGEVITTPLTFASTTHAIVRNGLKPIFCDVNGDDYTLDPDKIESLITEKTCAIVPVHVYGNVCNVQKIADIAEKYHLKVIYDAAHAFGVTVNGINIANFGDASMFSFHATKVFNTIEGGMVAYKDSKLDHLLYEIKNFGITEQGSAVECVGENAKMNEFQAAMGICNLRHLDREIEKRKVLAQQYDQRLGRAEGIHLCKAQPGVAKNYAYYPVMFDGYKRNRDEIFTLLSDHNIFTRKYFYPLTSCYACYAGQFDADKTPIAKHISESILTLPLYADLSLEDVNKICDIILG